MRLGPDIDQSLRRPLATVPLGEAYAVDGRPELVDVFLHEDVDDAMRARLLQLWRATSDVRPSTRMYLARRSHIPLGVEIDGMGRLVAVRLAIDVLPDAWAALEQSRSVGRRSRNSRRRNVKALQDLSQVISPTRTSAEDKAAASLPISFRRALAADLLLLLDELGRLGIVVHDVSDRSVLVRGADLPEVMLLGALHVVADDSDALRAARRLMVATAATLTWRLLLGIPGAIPDRTTVGLFDLLVGQQLGQSIFDMVDSDAEESGRSLQYILLVGIDGPTRRVLVEAARATGFAASLVRLLDLGLHVDDEALGQAARQQGSLEEQIAVATGSRRRDLQRELRRMTRAFDVDVAPQPDDVPVPATIRELEELVLAARFDELVLQFYDGVIPTLEQHPWIGRALTRSLAFEPVPTVTVAESGPIPEVRVGWPGTQHLNVVVARVRSGGVLLHEVTFERNESGRSIVLRHPFSPNVALDGQELEVRAGVRAPSGLVVEAPGGTTITPGDVGADGRSVLRASDAGNGVTFMQRLAGSAGIRRAIGAAERLDLDEVSVFFPPPPPAPSRRRRRNIRLALATASVGIAGLAIALYFAPPLGPFEVPARIEVAATTLPVGIEFVVAVRDLPEGSNEVVGLRLQQRTRRSGEWTEFSAWFAVRPGIDPSRARTLWIPAGLRSDERVEYRFVAELVGGDRVVGQPVRPSPASIMQSPVQPPTWTRHDITGPFPIIAWREPDLERSRIVRQSLLSVRYDNGVTRYHAVGDASFEVVPVEGAHSAVAQVLVTISDGTVTEWSRPLRLRFRQSVPLAMNPFERQQLPIATTTSTEE